LPRSPAPRRTTAGFTLIEVLVALSIVAVSLSAIGALIATTVRGTHSIEHRMTRLEAARALAAALPLRNQLVPGNTSGEIAGHRWRVDVSPFMMTNVGPRQTTPWVPQTVIVTVQPPTGSPVQMSTVRLHRRAGE